MSRFSELKAQGRFTRFPTPQSWGQRALEGGGVPPQSLQEKPLAKGLVFTFFTYADARVPLEERWKPTGLRDIFFDSYGEVRRTGLAMRNDVGADPGLASDTTYTQMVVTVPICYSSVLTLLNEAPGAFIAAHEVLETIGDRENVEVGSEASKT